MASLPYAQWFRTYFKAKNLSIEDVAYKVNFKYKLDRKVTIGELRDFLSGRHCPNAARTKAIEQAFGLNLPPELYGWGNNKKP